MSDMIEVRWEIEDGYVGKARPQSFKIDMDDMVRSCETAEEAARYIDDALQQDFEDKISWYSKNKQDVLDAWRTAYDNWITSQETT